LSFGLFSFFSWYLGFALSEFLFLFFCVRSFVLSLSISYEKQNTSLAGCRRVRLSSSMLEFIASPVETAAPFTEQESSQQCPAGSDCCFLSSPTDNSTGTICAATKTLTSKTLHGLCSVVAGGKSSGNNNNVFAGAVVTGTPTGSFVLDDVTCEPDASNLTSGCKFSVASSTATSSSSCESQQGALALWCEASEVPLSLRVDGWELVVEANTNNNRDVVLAISAASQFHAGQPFVRVPAAIGFSSATAAAETARALCRLAASPRRTSTPPPSAA
jgi:hypothetical protein